MAILTKFDRVNFPKVANDLAKAAQSVATKYGFTIEPAGGQIDDAVATFKLRAVLPEAMKDTFTKSAVAYGLPADGLGKTFISRSRTYTITGLDIGKRNPVTTVRDDGTIYTWPADLVAQLLAAAK
jgi:hypothetical protein